MVTETELLTLPFDKPDLLRTAPGMRALQALAPICRVRTATGDEAWLVTRYEQARALFGDPRLGRSHPKPAQAARISGSPLVGGAADNYDTEDADHNRMRARLVPCFSARRMRAVQPRVAELLDGLLSELANRTSPVDLHATLSFPLPVLVICELLGVPYADRDRFHTWSTGMADATDGQRAKDSWAAMAGYLRELVVHKRAEPADDIITELTGIEDGALSDDEIAGLATVVLFAGHETTVTRIDMGVLRLLTNPDQRAALLADPELVPAAVEEILRIGVGGAGQAGLPRYARADIEIDGVTIRTGDAVLLAPSVANQDPAVFEDPDTFNIGRPQPIAHLTFGHGARYCIGATLARIELNTVFGALFQRFPAMSLAVPVEQLRWRSNVVTGGFAELPVTLTS